MPYTRLRPHWRPTHDANPIGFDRWLGPDDGNAWAKILNPDGHLCRQVWTVAPQARICLRLHPLSEMQVELLRDPYRLGIDHAEQWRVWLTAQGVDASRVACEGINEAPIWNPGIIQAHNIYAGSFGKTMRSYGLTAVIGNFNTGWPANTGPDTPVDWSPLTPTLHAVRQYGHYLGLHEYWDARGIDADWGWNPGRFTQLPQEFRTLPILFTEVGYDRAVNAPSGTGNHGWAGELSIDQYMEQLTEYDSRIRAYANLEAAFIFTHDFDQPWGTWDTRPLLDRLCGHAEWVRQQPADQFHTTYIPVVTQPDPDAPTAEPVQPQPPAPGSNWERSIAFVARWEGGWVDNPADPGGATNKGITLGTYTNWRAAHGQPAPTKDDLRALTDEERDRILFEWYWLASRSDSLEWPLCLANFDTATNAGLGIAADMLQASRGDFLAYMGHLLIWYTKIRNFETFGRAWTQRRAEILLEAVK